MASGIRGWVDGLLERRGLIDPDGRPLYAYRMTAEEFESLGDALSNSKSSMGVATMPIMLGFVLYAAEWWQRHYDGGTWAWEPLLAALRWNSVHYPDLYGPVRTACHWWQVKMVYTASSTRYLTTFACQGGLPLGLVGSGENSVTQFLRATLRDTAKYRLFTDDPVELAQRQQHLLRPETLRRDYVFQLAADLAAAVLNLEIGDEDDPLKGLNERQPDWQRTMPIDLEDERARQLLVGLVREAALHRARSVTHFGVERFLRRTEFGWRLGARVELPRNIPPDALADELNVETETLPRVMSVRIGSGRTRQCGVFERDESKFVLRRSTQREEVVWDEEAESEIHLECFAGKRVGDPFVPSHGSMLSDLPWAFEGEAEPVFRGEGSTRSRGSTIKVMALERSEVSEEQPSGEESEKPEATQVKGRLLWTFSEPTTMKTPAGRFEFIPRSEPTEETEYRVSGRRVRELESRWPLFRGMPNHLEVIAQGRKWEVPTDEVSWRPTRGEWRRRPDGYGLWEVRHVHNGTLRHRARFGILPRRFRFSIIVGDDMGRGRVVLEGGEHVKVSAEVEDGTATPRPLNDGAEVLVSAHNVNEAPTHVELSLHWAREAALTVHVPFPGRGGRFLHNGRRLMRRLTVDDLYGVRAVALFPREGRSFWISAEVQARDLRERKGLRRFRHPLTPDGTRHELALIEIREKIARRLSASTMSEACIELHIVDEDNQKYATAEVARFTNELRRFDGREIALWPIPSAGTRTKFEAWRIAEPTARPIPLETITVQGNRHGTRVPIELNMSTERILIVAQNGALLIQPIAIGGTTGSWTPRGSAGRRQDVSLAEAVNILHDAHRDRAIRDAMQRLLEEQNRARREREWEFLNETLLRQSSLPASTSDVLRVAARTPAVLVRWLLKIEPTHRAALWELEDDLPFSWGRISNEIWAAEKEHAISEICEAVREVMEGDQRDMAEGLVDKILSEGRERMESDTDGDDQEPSDSASQRRWTHK